MNAKARKTEINLITLGTGVICSGLWTLLKFAVTFVLLVLKNEEGLNWEAWLIIGIFVWLFVIADVLLRFYIGFSARGEGKGKCKRILYLITSVIVLALYLLTIINEIVIMVADPEKFTGDILTIIVDVSFFVLLTEVIINSVAIRKIRKDSVSEEADL